MQVPFFCLRPFLHPLLSSFIFFFCFNFQTIAFAQTLETFKKERSTVIDSNLKAKPVDKLIQGNQPNKFAFEDPNSSKNASSEESFQMQQAFQLRRLQLQQDRTQKMIQCVELSSNQTQLKDCLRP